MYDILHNLLDRLEKQGAELGEERMNRIRAEQERDRLNGNARDVILMLDAMCSGQKIEAIKCYRSLTGAYLKDSKEAIERVMDRMSLRSAA